MAHYYSQREVREMAHYYSPVTDTVTVTNEVLALDRVDETPYWTEKVFGIQVACELVGTQESLATWFYVRRKCHPEAHMEVYEEIGSTGVFRAVCAHDRC